MAKKAVFVVILIIFLVLVYADGNAKDVPMDKIEKALTQKTDIETMARCDNRNLMQFFGLDYEKFNSHLYYKSKEALGVEEVLIVKVNRKEDLNGVKDAVEKRIESQITTFEGYGPQQVAMLEDAIVTTKGSYLFYATGKHSETIEEVFKDVI